MAHKLDLQVGKYLPKAGKFLSKAGRQAGRVSALKINSGSDIRRGWHPEEPIEV